MLQKTSTQTDWLHLQKKGQNKTPIQDKQAKTYSRAFVSIYCRSAKEPRRANMPEAVFSTLTTVPLGLSGGVEGCFMLHVQVSAPCPINPESVRWGFCQTCLCCMAGAFGLMNRAERGREQGKSPPLSWERFRRRGVGHSGAGPRFHRPALDLASVNERLGRHDVMVTFDNHYIRISARGITSTKH